jgi:tetratricopeptide (TPR) repeat protein
LLLDQYRAEPAVADLVVLLDVHRRSGNRREELKALLALGRAHYIMSLDHREFAEQARDTYAAALDLAEALEDLQAMAMALIPTSWFTDYWADYRPVALANLDRALHLARACGDEDLIVDARSAFLRLRSMEDVAEEAEELLAQLEARRDPVRLKELCFWMMWRYYMRDELHRCIAVCDRGIELAIQLNSAPVQYGTIKALALVELGRYDLVEAAIAQEVTDDDHPFGRACAHWLARYTSTGSRPLRRRAMD